LGNDPAFQDEAVAAGALIAKAGLTLVYGGGKVGLMGAVADAALAAGGKVVGVMPADLVNQEIGHKGLTELKIVNSMHERKWAMAELADGFLALPGGLGTLEELAEVLSWAQLDLHDKPIGLFDVGGYFSALEAFLDHAVAEGFVAARHRRLLLRDDDLIALLGRFDAWEPPAGRFDRPRPLDPPLG